MTSLDDTNPMTDISTTETSINTEVLVQPPYRLTGGMALPQGKVPTGTKPRRLLAMLMINAGSTVKSITLMDELWEREAPKTASTTLQTYVYKLREALGDHRRPESEWLIQSVPGGYRFDVNPASVDALAFIEAVKGLVIRPHYDEQVLRRILEELEASLALLSGPALDVPSGPRLQQFAELLQEWRLTAIFREVKVKVMLGQHDDVLPVLLFLIQENPYNEEFVMWRMLGLYRSGQLSLALQTFNGLRQTLREELGMDPGLKVQNLHQMILRRDDRLLQETGYMF